MKHGVLNGCRGAACAAMVASAVLPAVAQLGAGAETNTVYQTGIVTNNAWSRDVVTERWSGGEPELMDRQGAFVSTADMSALEVSSANAHKVAAAWSDGFNTGTNMLAEAMVDAPTNGTFFKLCFPLIPSSTRRSVDIFVVSNTYDAVRNRDCLWIYVSRDLPMKPIVRVPYVWESGFSTNYAVGAFTVQDVPQSHWTNTVSITRFGETYAKCHRCWFTRPAELAGIPIFMNRHGSFGGRDGSGMDWGSIAVLVDNQLTYTGSITNAAEGTVATFENGAFLGITHIGE